MMKEFPLKISRGKSDPATLALIDELLAQPGAEAQAAALALHRPAGTGRRRRAERRSRGESPFAVDRRQCDRSRGRLECAAVVPRTLDRAARSSRRSSGALGDSDPQVRSAAVRLALEPKAKIAESALRKALDDPAPAARIALLERIAAEAELKNDLRLLGVVSNSLVDEHGGVCEKALQLIQSQPALVANAAIENGLRELVQSAKTADRQREIAKALLATRGRSSSSAGDVERAARPGLLQGQGPADLQPRRRRRPELHGLPPLAHDS